MRTSLIMTIIGFVYVILHFVSLRQKAKTKDLVVSTIILLSGASLYLMVMIELPIPSLVELIGYMFRPLYKPVAGWIMEGTTGG